MKYYLSFIVLFFNFFVLKNALSQSKSSLDTINTSTVNVFGNGYVYPQELDEEKGLIQKNGLSAWQDKNIFTRVYFYPQQTGSVFVMVAGFVLISIGIFMSYYGTDKNNLIKIISASSGILTEFIGATFIFIYNSTIKQAINYTNSLEKINSVGMSIKILESIKIEPANAEKLNDAKIEIAKILIDQAQKKNEQAVT